MATPAPNSTSSSQGNPVHDDTMSSSILVVAGKKQRTHWCGPPLTFIPVVSGVIVGLLLGWATLDTSFRARRQFVAWFRWKMGFEVKERDQPQADVRASQSAVWDAKENGYPTPKLDTQVSTDLHTSQFARINCARLPILYPSP
jgi:hypothetical protein